MENYRKSFKDKQRIIVINKKDLERNIKLPENLENVVETDTNSIEGIDSLKSKIKEMFNLEKITTKDYTYLSNSRQISLITKAYQSILSAEKSLNESLPIDLIAIDLKECFDLLMKNKLLNKTFKMPVPEEEYQKIKESYERE